MGEETVEQLGDGIVQQGISLEVKLKGWSRRNAPMAAVTEWICVHSKNQYLPNKTEDWLQNDHLDFFIRLA